jgi:hypothetical protein
MPRPRAVSRRIGLCPGMPVRLAHMKGGYSASLGGTREDRICLTHLSIGFRCPLKCGTIRNVKRPGSHIAGCSLPGSRHVRLRWFTTIPAVADGKVCQLPAWRTKSGGYSSAKAWPPPTTEARHASKIRLVLCPIAVTRRNWPRQSLRPHMLAPHASYEI